MWSHDSECEASGLIVRTLSLDSDKLFFGLNFWKQTLFFLQCELLTRCEHDWIAIIHKSLIFGIVFTKVLSRTFIKKCCWSIVLNYSFILWIYYVCSYALINCPDLCSTSLKTAYKLIMWCEPVSSYIIKQADSQNLVYFVIFICANKI